MSSNNSKSKEVIASEFADSEDVFDDDSRFVTVAEGSFVITTTKSGTVLEHFGETIANAPGKAVVEAARPKTFAEVVRTSQKHPFRIHASESVPTKIFELAPFESFESVSLKLFQLAPMEFLDYFPKHTPNPMEKKIVEAKPLEICKAEAKDTLDSQVTKPFELASPDTFMTVAKKNLDSAAKETAKAAPEETVKKPVADESADPAHETPEMPIAVEPAADGSKIVKSKPRVPFLRRVANFFKPGSRDNYDLSQAADRAYKEFPEELKEMHDERVKNKNASPKKRCDKKTSQQNKDVSALIQWGLLMVATTQTMQNGNNNGTLYPVPTQPKSRSQIRRLLDRPRFGRSNRQAGLNNKEENPVNVEDKDEEKQETYEHYVDEKAELKRELGIVDDRAKNAQEPKDKKKAPVQKAKSIDAIAREMKIYGDDVPVRNTKPEVFIFPEPFPNNNGAGGDEKSEGECSACRKKRTARNS